MVRRNRFAGVTVLGAVLALGLATLGNVALADGEIQPARPRPPGRPPARRSRPTAGPVKDIYCTHNTAKSKLPACGDSFKATCAKIGGN